MQYLILGGVAVSVVALTLLKGITLGKQSATIDNLKSKLQDKALETQVRADIDAATASARRKQLQDRWAKR